MGEQQRTLAKEITFSGAGLHTGTSATVRVLPAPASSGIVFVRTDLPNRPSVPVCPAHAADSGVGMRRTMLAKDGVEVHTVEHFLAALWGLGIDNAIVEISGPELPGMDGSAAPVVQLIKAAGVVSQDAPRREITLREPIMVEDQGCAIAAYPSPMMSVSYTLSYPNHPVLKTQFVTFTPSEQSFEELIAPARTYCLVEEAETLRAKGFGQGANYTNTLVIGREGVINNTLRFTDEFVRHKVLDLLGDLSLVGGSLRAHIVALKSGHRLNMRLVQKLTQAVAAAANGTPKAAAAPSNGAAQPLDVRQIQQILPHRFPFLLVDRVLELTETKATAIKNVTMNEHFFQGHFPNRPVMPGVLMIEAMAQVGGLLILNKPEHRGKIAYFMSVDKVKFRKPVVPGDQLILEVEVGKIRSRTGQMFGKAYVEGKVVCEGELMFALADE